LQARAQLGVAVGEIFPQTLQAVGSVPYYRTSDRASTSAAFNGSLTYWQFQFGSQASCELDFWSRIRRRVESADASLLSALADYDNTLVTPTADVANPYIGSADRRGAHPHCPRKRGAPGVDPEDRRSQVQVRNGDPAGRREGEDIVPPEITAEMRRRPN
jgi:hypothetical protein